MATQADRFDALDDEALAKHLVDEAERRREHLSIEERDGRWVAQTWQTDGLSSGRTVTLGAAGPDRRTAMLGLAEKFEAARW
jgi:MoxR-like ATPase